MSAAAVQSPTSSKSSGAKRRQASSGKAGGAPGGVRAAGRTRAARSKVADVRSAVMESIGGDGAATLKRVTEYEEIQAQIQRLQERAREIVQHEKSEVIARMRAMVAQYGIKASDLGLRGASGSRSAPQPQRAKYALGENSWVGRGKRPEWFKAALAAGTKPEQMLVRS